MKPVMIALASVGVAIAAGVYLLAQPSQTVQLRRGMVAALKDPDSAKFRNERVGGHLITVVCGEVNSKNSLGGYVGYERYIGAGEAYAMASGAWNWSASGEDGLLDLQLADVLKEMETLMRAGNLTASSSTIETAALAMRFDRLWDRHCKV